MSTHRIKWDHYFAQWCKHWLPFLGLQAEEKPRFSQLPLEADVLIIRPDDLEGRWQKHPVWQHVSPYTVLEFKSVQDPFQAADWGKLMAYVGLTMEREKLRIETEIAGWLIVPSINRTLKQALQHHQIALQTLLPGLHKGHTGLFPLVIIEFNDLPLEAPFLELKSFMKQGPVLREVMLLALKKWLKESGFLYQEYSTIITSIHTQEAEKVIEVLEQDMPKIKRMANKLVKMLGDEADSLDIVRQKEQESIQKGLQKGLQKGIQEGKLETARQMKADGMAAELIRKYTGLSLKAIQAL